MTAEKPRHIVVFSANGGIGQAVLKKLADAVEDGKPYSISVITRKGDQFATGIIDEILDGRSFDKNKRDNLAQAFENAKHAVLDPKNLDNLQDVLRDADVVISAGGLPRPNLPEGAKPVERTDLIYPNSKVVIPIAKAMARFAPMDAMLLLCTNPLDNMVQVADDTLRAEWKNAGRVEPLPEVKVVGMSSTLDQIRMKKFTARALNAALKQAGSDIRINHSRDEISAEVYGQHGPKMVLDFDAIMVAPKGCAKLTLKEFIAEHNLQDIKVPAIIKGKADTALIEAAIQANTTAAGTKQNNDLGRSAQTSTANRLVEMVDQFCSHETSNVLACVNSGFLGDSHAVAYGRPITIGNGKVNLATFPEAIKDGSPVADKIKASRKAVSDEQKIYTACKTAEDKILPVLKNGGCEITINDDLRKAKSGVTFTASRAVDIEKFASIKDSLKTLLGVEDGVAIVYDTQRVMDCMLEPKSQGALNTLAEELGIKIGMKQQITATRD